MTREYYQVLGVSETATLKEIKKSYRKLAQQWHPDKWNTKSLEERKKANKMMQELNKVYEILSDEDKRKRYDLGIKDFPDDNSSHEYEEEIRRREEELLRKQAEVIDIELKILKMEMRALDRSSTLNEIGAAFDFTFPQVRKEDLDPSLWQPYGNWMKKVVEMPIIILDGKSRSEELRSFKEEMVKAIKEAETALKIKEENKKRNDVNSELNRARTEAFEYIEKEMSEKGLKDEDLGEYFDYKNQINNLERIYSIRDLREEALSFISKLERRREPEHRQDDYYPPKEQSDSRFPNNPTFSNDNPKPRQNPPYYSPQESRDDPNYSPQSNSNPRFPENPRQPERFPDRYDEPCEREQERGIVNISSGIFNGKYDNWTREQLIAEIEEAKLNNATLQKLVNSLETLIK